MHPRRTGGGLQGSQEPWPPGREEGGGWRARSVMPHILGRPAAFPLAPSSQQPQQQNFSLSASAVRRGTKLFSAAVAAQGQNLSVAVVALQKLPANPQTKLNLSPSIAALQVAHGLL